MIGYPERGERASLKLSLTAIKSTVKKSRYREKLSKQSLKYFWCWLTWYSFFFNFFFLKVIFRPLKITVWPWDCPFKETNFTKRWPTVKEDRPQKDTVCKKSVNDKYKKSGLSKFLQLFKCTYILLLNLPAYFANVHKK